ncbi:Protein of unknown function [Cotesia congregata]|uniref:Uncharacterized protein n=1 Tax=Cotesia congregata TaxID=51543 RepID=A0A8J2MER0_COTCN|nr:Protein of unknown function [Cotesia congregata]
MKMVKLMSSPLKGILNARRGHSAESIISDWRFKSQLAPLEMSIARRDLNNNTKPKEAMDIILKVKTLEINSSFDTMKIDRGISEHWSNVLRYRWPIVVQSVFLIIIIAILGLRIGLRDNQDPGIHSNYNKFSLWPPFNSISPSTFKASDYSYGGCNYGFYCGGIKTTDGELVRRKASFLKRKRNLKELID